MVGSKRLRGFIMAVTITAMVSQGGILANAESYKLKIDNVLKKDHIEVVDKDNSVYFPLRSIAESLNYKVGWDQITSTVKLSKGTRQISLTNGKSEIEVHELSNGLKIPSKLSNNVEVIKGTTMVTLDMLDIMGVAGYNRDARNKSMDIYSKFMVADVGQDSVYGDRATSSKDLARLNQLTHAFGEKNGIRVVKSDYLESTSIEDMYKYLSKLPTSEEIASKEYSWGDYLSEGVNKATVQKLSRLKTLAPMAGIDMEYEPTVFYNIGGKVHLIGGYINYKGSDVGINHAYKNYVENYETITWKLMKDSDKVFVRTEISKLMEELNKDSEMILFLVQDGSVVYMD